MANVYDVITREEALRHRYFCDPKSADIISQFVQWMDTAKARIDELTDDSESYRQTLAANEVYCLALTTRAESAEVANQELRRWLPISEAPRTGEHILVTSLTDSWGTCGGKKQRPHAIVHWFDDAFYLSLGNQDEPQNWPTHFKSLDETAALLGPQHATVDDESRCAVCGWKLAESTPAGTLTRGCVRGNCSLRPKPEKLYAPERAARETEMVWGGPQHGQKESE